MMTMMECSRLFLLCMVSVLSLSRDVESTESVGGAECSEEYVAVCQVCSELLPEISLEACCSDPSLCEENALHNDERRASSAAFWKRGPAAFWKRFNTDDEGDEDDFLGEDKRAKYFLGKRGKYFLGKRRLRNNFLGKREDDRQQGPSLRRRAKYFLGKRSEGMFEPAFGLGDDDDMEKRAKYFLGKRAKYFLGKRDFEDQYEDFEKRAKYFLGKRMSDDDFKEEKRAKYFLGKRSAEPEEEEKH